MKVILNVDIDFFNFKGQEVELKQGTEILVEPSEGIGFKDDDYFFIKRHEYTVIN